MRAYVKLMGQFHAKIGYVVMWLTTLLVLVVCYDVFTRYALKESSVAVQELEWHIFGIIFLIGAAYTLRKDRHVRVDVFYTRFSEKTKAWVDLVGSIIFLIPFCVVIIMTSKRFVAQSFLIGEKSPDPGGLPGRYLLKACITIGFLFLLLEGISIVFRSVLTLTGRHQAPGAKNA